MGKPCPTCGSVEIKTGRTFCSRRCSKLNSRGTAVERFWACVEKTDGCWTWGKSKRGGYGRFRVDGKSTGAHRFSWELHNEKRIPEGMLVLHRCDNPPCVNPSHLFIGTGDDNMADKVAKGRQSRLRGERHPVSKLKEIDIPDIRVAHGTISEIADRYGVSRSLIFMVKNRQAWAHV